MAQAKPVSTRPTIIQKKLSARAMAIQPMIQGIAANLMVFSRPKNSISTPANSDPIGTIITIIDAIHEDWAFVTTTSLVGSSSCGIKMAEYANEIPMTMWKAAAIMAEKICGKADFMLVSYLLRDRQLAMISRNASSLFCSVFSLFVEKRNEKKNGKNRISTNCDNCCV